MSAEETKVSFPAEDGVSLEGRLAGKFDGEAWIICHPHPQYGGSMHNNVVLTARDVLLDLGKGTLRFNFRGVGASEGSFDDGRGEALDVEGAASHLRSEHGAKRVCVAAYSFGSRVFLGALKRGLVIDRAAIISPPVSFLDFSPYDLPDGKSAIVVGEYDEFCRRADLDRWLEGQQEKGKDFELSVLTGVDHFFGGAEALLSETLRTALRGS